jgi:hypothetical protein
MAELVGSGTSKVVTYCESLLACARHACEESNAKLHVLQLKTFLSMTTVDSTGILQCCGLWFRFLIWRQSPVALS